MNVRLNRESKRKAVADASGYFTAKELLAKATNRDALRFDTIMCYVLHDVFGFGHDRLLRYLKGITDAHLYTLDRYGEQYQDSAYTEMLRRDGIDMVELERELEEYQGEKGLNI